MICWFYCLLKCTQCALCNEYIYVISNQVGLYNTSCLIIFINIDPSKALTFLYLWRPSPGKSCCFLSCGQYVKSQLIRRFSLTSSLLLDYQPIQYNTHIKKFHLRSFYSQNRKVCPIIDIQWFLHLTYT